jgi:hypothetical protein
MKLVHIINPFLPKPDSWSDQYQKFTFEGIRIASQNPQNPDLECLTAQFAEDHSFIPEWFRKTPDLGYSACDLEGLGGGRKLPFLADILDATWKFSIADYVVFSNVDIIPAPNFYIEIQKLIQSGHHSFSINRRTVPKFDFGTVGLQKIFDLEGEPHPGHDCFVFPHKLIPQLELGRVLVGIPWVGLILHANLALKSPGFQTFAETFLTRHLGDDLDWTSNANLPYRQHNAKIAHWFLNKKKENFVRMGKKGDYYRKHLEMAQKQVQGLAPVFQKTLKSDNRLIFCINSGRAGSEYLTTLLGSAKDVAAFHEPHPAMSGRFLEMVNRLPLEKTFAERKIKVEAIREKLRELPPGKIYAETNHMFIKTFFDVVLDSFPRENITIVVLRRDLIKVLKSFLSMGYFSSKNQAWPLWMHCVPSANSLFKPPRSYNKMTQSERILSYLFDIECKIENFLSKNKDLNVVEINLDQIQIDIGIDNFFSQLGVDRTPMTKKVQGVPVNLRNIQKEIINSSITIRRCENIFKEFIESCKIEDVSLPRRVALLSQFL